ncbi:uncharacterized protein PSFLO_05261 [Pseudozyma flocculosa]|uniref:Rrn7/TAF1B C-terminal cyclin domain-containing protein n=1 Tax=Pseudozyma flocculosa TaxID=84751 RepID=A0A5C3F6J9_9BASI|nr:uncharacterized protein PSFLO_05261 [Pseudozyma flocculosa]
MSSRGFGATPSGSGLRSLSQPVPINPPSSSPSLARSARIPQPIFSASQPTPATPARANRPTCFECGTHRMRVRRGQLICKYGHVQHNFRIEHAFDDEFEESQRTTARRKMTRAKRKRTFTSRRTGAVSELEDDDDEEDDDDDETAHDLSYLDASDGQHGRKRSRSRSRRSRSRGRSTAYRAGTGTDAKMQGRFKRLQCLQLILRMQLHQLNHHFGGNLPPETETVARELWALLVASLPVSEFPPEPLVAATFDYRATHDIDDDRDHIRTDRGTEPIYDVRHDFELEDRLAERDRRKRIEAKRQQRKRKGAFEPESDAQTSGTEGFTDDDHAPGDLQDPEDMLASLDPVFAKERRDKRRREGSQGAQGDGMRSDSDQDDDDDDEDEYDGDGDGHGHGEDDAGRQGSQTSSRRSGWRRKQGRRRLAPIYKPRSAETTDAESEWSEGYRSAGASSTASRRQARQTGSRRLHPGGSGIGEKRRLMKFASLPSTLAILYLTLSKLQIPILWGDLTELAASYRLTFLEAVQRLPPDLVLLLNADDVRYGKLDVSSVPAISSLNVHAAKLATLLHVNFGITFEEPSGAVMLWRLVDGMGLPPTIYCAAKRLLSFVGVQLHITPAAAAAGEESGAAVVGEGPAKRGRPSRRTRSMEQRYPVPREFIMMAVVLVLVKMRYGMDGQGRYEDVVYPAVEFGASEDGQQQGDTTTTGGEAGPSLGFVSGLPTLRRWVTALRETSEAKRHDAASTHEVYRAVEPLDMTPGEVDGYLSFLETNLILPNPLALYNWRRTAERDDLLSFGRAMDLSSSLAGQFDSVSSSASSPRPGGGGGLTTDPSGTVAVESHRIYMDILDHANALTRSSND